MRDGFLPRNCCILRVTEHAERVPWNHGIHSTEVLSYVPHPLAVCSVLSSTGIPVPVGTLKPRECFGADVVGPYRPSPSGYRYTLDVVDFFSGYGYSFLMKHKSETPRHLMALILRLENSEYHVKCIQGYVTDDGGDTIMSHNLQDFLRDRGIYWQTAPRETPNYNAMVKRNIQTKKARKTFCGPYDGPNPKVALRVKLKIASFWN